MAQLIRTGGSGAILGVGHVRQGVIHTVPDELVDALLASGQWARPNATQPSGRVTEPAPRQPASPVEKTRKAPDKKR